MGSPDYVPYRNSASREQWRPCRFALVPSRPNRSNQIARRSRCAAGVLAVPSIRNTSRRSEGHPREGRTPLSECQALHQQGHQPLQGQSLTLAGVCAIKNRRPPRLLFPSQGIGFANFRTAAQAEACVKDWSVTAGTDAVMAAPPPCTYLPVRPFILPPWSFADPGIEPAPALSLALIQVRGHAEMEDTWAERHSVDGQGGS